MVMEVDEISVKIAHALEEEGLAHHSQLILVRLGGFANANFRLDLPNGERFMIKGILESHKTADKELEAQYVARTRSSGIPTAAYVPWKSGVFVMEYEGIRVMRQEWLNGGEPKVNSSTSRSVFEMLARLHQVSSEGVPPRRSWLEPGRLTELMALARSHNADDEDVQFGLSRKSCGDVLSGPPPF
ncbi:MAG TPA: phosphotransferase [Patescibacteria group bacterium]|nr:phosphotransferase [Patescibacteria group bacterium]